MRQFNFTTKFLIFGKIRVTYMQFDVKTSVSMPFFDDLIKLLLKDKLEQLSRIEQIDLNSNN